MRYKSIVLAAGLGAALCFGSGSEPRGRRPRGAATATASATTPAAVTSSHARVADTALLIREPRVLDTRTDLRFSEVVKIAFGVNGQRIVRNWLWNENGRRPCSDSRFPINRLYCQWLSSPASSTVLLAVANRLDAAEFRRATGKVEGAEIRFVYTGAGAKDADDEYARLIVEFVLAPMSKSQFRQLALDTKQFATSDLAASAYLDWIRRMTRTARLRISVNSGTTWEYGEFSLQAGALRAAPLERDLSVAAAPIYNCLEKGSCVGGELAALSADILVSRFVLPAARQAAISVVGGSDPILRLKGFGSAQDDLRFSLSINSCRGCHGGEVQLKFHHLGFRTHGRTSSISHFLGGDNGTGGGPVVNKWTPTLSTIDCETGSVIHGRPVNDLLRRHSLLHAIGELAANASNADWEKVFSSHGLVATSR